MGMIRVDDDLHAAINARRVALEAKLGIKLSLNQALRLILDGKKP